MVNSNILEFSSRLYLFKKGIRSNLISMGLVPRSSASKEVLFCLDTSTALLRGSSFGVIDVGLPRRVLKYVVLKKLTGFPTTSVNQWCFENLIKENQT